MSHAGGVPVKDLQTKLEAEVTIGPPFERLGVASDQSAILAQLGKLDEFALLDAIRRHESLVQLMYHTDRKAVQLIGIYFAIIGFVSTISIANLKVTEMWMVASAFLIVLVLAIGVQLAYRAQSSVIVFLTGMKPDFWQWARRHDISTEDVIASYLERVGAALVQNECINAKSARALAKSYVCGRLALILGVLCFALFLLKAIACHLPLAWVAGRVCPL